MVNLGSRNLEVVNLSAYWMVMSLACKKLTNGKLVIKIYKGEILSIKRLSSECLGKEICENLELGS